MRFTSISRNRRCIRSRSWNATLMEAESSIASQKPIETGARPSPNHLPRPSHPPEIALRSVLGDNHVQESEPGTGMTKGST